jgi:glycosyltransferase involved in cell wall biosynthesis
MKDFKALVQITRALKKTRPDILSCHSSKAGLLGRIAARLAGIPVIFTAHGWAFTEGVPEKERKFYRLVEKVAALFSSHIITVSEYDRDLALKSGIVSPEKITAIHTGMPDRPCLVRPDVDGPVRLMMVARVGPQKDHGRLLRALWGCMDLHWTLDIVGGGDDLELRRMAQQMEMEDRVMFRGERDDVPELMDKSADIYVLTSNWEGLPRSILEAMRSGLPVIASDVGGVRECVVAGDTGLVVPPGQDQPLVRALQHLIPDMALQKKMGRRGRERFEKHFTFLEMARRTFGIYEKVLGKTSGPSSGPSVDKGDVASPLN